MRLLRLVDALLDRITMYRLLLYYLVALLAAAAGLNLVAHVLYDPWAVIFSASYLCLACWVANTLFARVYKAPVNTESALITGLILALIITPIASTHDVIFLTAAAGLAMASKYLLAIRHQHIFNPAAAAVALTAFGAGQSASWWVGAAPLMPVVVIGGLLVARKIQRLQMVLIFAATVLVATAVYAGLGHGSMGTALSTTVMHSPLWFLAFVMLTEPMTSPSTKAGRPWYALLTGVLLPPQVHFGSLYSTPELTLLVGNLFAYIVNPGIKVRLRLLQKRQLAPDTLDLVFAPERALRFRPGQYMEFTLPHRDADGRGGRRYFTLASSPTEDTLRLGVKFYQPGSSYKRALRVLDARTPIAAGQLGGDFVLPGNTGQKLVFMAGGIGITPFRSMLKYLVDTHDQRAVTLFYAERNARELVYGDVLQAAQRELGAKVVYVLQDPSGAPSEAVAGRIDARLIATQVPDYAQRLFYLSGPHSMVTAMTGLLHDLGVPGHQIKTDFFPGYA